MRIEITYNSPNFIAWTISVCTLADKFIDVSRWNIVVLYILCFSLGRFNIILNTLLFPVEAGNVAFQIIFFAQGFVGDLLPS